MLWFQLFCALMILFGHTWNMLGHRTALKQGNDDQSHDHLVDKRGILLGVWALIMGHALLTWRILLILQGKWHPDVLPYKLLELPPVTYHPLLFYSGALIFVLGWALRSWAYRTLGHFFTFEIGIRGGHKIIRQGPYRYIRHPSYSGYFLMGLGIALNSCSTWALLFLLLVGGVFFTLRIRDEEKMLAQHFGQDFLEYKRSTKRLIPWIF